MGAEVTRWNTFRAGGSQCASRARMVVCQTVLLAMLLASKGYAGPVFTDAAKSAGLIATHVPLDAMMNFESWFNGGLAVADFNRDGYDDVFYVSGGGVPDKLFINDGTGHFTDEAAAWGLTDLHAGVGASAADYNNDGWIDLFVTSFGSAESGATTGAHRLYRNNAGASFTNVAAEAGVAFTSTFLAGGNGSAWGDYDLDGDLDLFVGQWRIDGMGNRLYRNNGDGTFTNVTNSSGLGPINGIVWGFQPCFADMNGDRWPELLIAADFESSRYYVNDGDGTFTEYTDESGTGLDDEGMGSTVGDLNRDGRLDWYVTSVHNENPPPGANIGNMLYLNQGDHQYVEASNQTGCNDGGWGWGAAAVDLDHDGWVDLVEVNGRPSTEWHQEPSKLFYNISGATGTLAFNEMAQQCGFEHAANATVLLCFDPDRDGDQDLIAHTNYGDLAYFENVTPSPGSWLTVQLTTSNNPLLAPDGFGAHIEVTAGGVTHVRVIDGRPTFQGTGPHRAHFGLGSAALAEEVRVMWPRGYDTVLHDVPLNQHLQLDAPPPGDVNGDLAVNVADLLDLLSAWGDCPAPPTLCPADTNGDAVIDVGDLLMMLANWGG